ncbi:MAG: hypothetical protein ACKOYK_01215 [Cyanobium sp.]
MPTSPIPAAGLVDPLPPVPALNPAGQLADNVSISSAVNKAISHRRQACIVTPRTSTGCQC